MMKSRYTPAGEPCRDWKDTLADVLMLLAIGFAGVVEVSLCVNWGIQL